MEHNAWIIVGAKKKKKTLLNDEQIKTVLDGHSHHFNKMD